MPYNRPNGTEWWFKAAFYAFAAGVAILAGMAASHAHAADLSLIGSVVGNPYDSTFSFTPTEDITVSSITQAIAFFNNPTAPVYAAVYFDNSCTGALEGYMGSSTEIFPPQGSYGSTTAAFFPPLFLQSGLCYTLHYNTPNGGDILNDPMNGPANITLSGDPGFHVSTLRFLVPVNGTSSPSSFGAWRLDFENFSDSASTTITVYYGGSLPLTFQNSTILDPLAPASYDVTVPRSTSLTPGVYFAQAIAYDGTATTTVIAISPEISFSVDVPLPPNSSSTLTGGTGLLSILITNISRKPPFGYFTAIEAGFSGLSTSTPAFVFLSTSTISSFSVIFSPVRLGFTWLIIIMGAFWVYHRLRNFNF